MNMNKERIVVNYGERHLSEEGSGLLRRAIDEGREILVTPEEGLLIDGRVVMGPEELFSKKGEQNVPRTTFLFRML